MSRNKYELISTFLHFNDNRTRVPRRQDGYDPLHKVRPMIDIVDPTYQAVYNPQKELALDESMIKYKGRIFFRQYMPAKPTKWGIKTFALCESNTGYALRFMVYTGKTTFQGNQGSNLSMTEQVEMEMIKGYENKGHVLYTDNFYTSPQLYMALKSVGIGGCGTVKPSRKYLPYDLMPQVLVINKGDSSVFMRTESLMNCVP